MRDDRNDPEREVYFALGLFLPFPITRDPEREDSRTAKIDALCDRLELQMMGIKP